MRKAFALAVLCFTVAVVAACAQDAVPSEILARTLLMKNDVTNSYGTAVIVEHKGVAYLVTARHMVERLPVTKAPIEVWLDNEWKTIQTVKTIFPSSNDADIAVLKTNEKIPKPYEITPTADNEGGGFTMRQQVWFLGYPYQIGTQFAPGPHPTSTGRLVSPKTRQ